METESGWVAAQIRGAGRVFQCEVTNTFQSCLWWWLRGREFALTAHFRGPWPVARCVNCSSVKLVPKTRPPERGRFSVSRFPGPS